MRKSFCILLLCLLATLITAGVVDAARLSSFNFGVHPVAGASSQPVAVPVDASLNGQALHASLSNATEFSTASTCTVASGTCTVTVSFSPKYAGLRKDALRLTDSQGNIVANSYLRGTGSGPQMVFSPGIISLKDGRSTANVAVDQTGNAYFICDWAVYRLGPNDTQPTLFAGTGNEQRYPASGDGGPATATDLEPTSIALDGDGNLVIASAGDIRKVDHRTGIISTLATANALLQQGFSAAFITIDLEGNVIGGGSNNLVFKLDAQTGTATLVAGNGQFGSSGDGGPAVSASLLPAALAVDASGAVLIGEYMGRIRRIDPQTNIINTIAGNGTPGHTGDGGLASAAEIKDVSVLTVDGVGSIYLACVNDPTIRKIDAATGIISTVAGTDNGYRFSDGLAANHVSFSAYGLAVDPAGNLYVGQQAGFAEIVSESTNIAFTAPGSFGTPPETFLLTNIGNAGLQLQSEALSGPFSPSLGSTASACSYPATLNPGANCSVSLTYDPAQGTASGAYTVIANGRNGLAPSQIASLHVGFPVLTTSPSPVVSGYATLNQPSRLQVEISNTGKVPLLVQNMSLTGLNASDFSIDTPCPTSILAPGDYCTLTLLVAANSVGVKTASLQIDDNALVSPQLVPLSVTVNSGALLAPLSSDIVFHFVPIGQSASQVVYLRNAGPMPITSSDISLTVGAGPFSVSQLPGPDNPVAPGASVPVTITFTPTSDQAQFGELSGAALYTRSVHYLNLVGTARAASSNYHDDTDAEIVYAGSWGHNQAPGRFGGTQSFSRRTGDSASFRFTGTQVAYVYDAQSNLGHVQVSIDGTFVSADLDEYSAVSKPQQRQIYTGLTDGPHTITVTVLGTQDPAASAPYAVVDSFLVGPAATTYDDGDPAISYSGTWGQNTAAQRYLGTQTFSNLANNQASLTFTGTQVTYIYEAQQNMGHARISIDGSVVTPDLDEYSPTLLSQQQLSYTGLSAGTHTITVTVLGIKDAGSSNTYVIVDAFLTNATSTGTYDDVDPAIRYSGSWGQNTTDGRYHGTQTFSRAAGDSASFTFTGDRISYVYAAQWNLGHAQISIDNTVVTADLDEYSPTPKPQQRLLYSGLGSGPHTIKVTALGTTNPNSSDSYVIIDAFTVGEAGSGTYDDADPEVGYQGNWGHNLAYGRYAATQSFSNVAGDTASFTFTGTEVAYLYAVQGNLGHVKISIDGAVMTADLDESMPDPAHWDPWLTTKRRQIYSGLSQGTHTITVTVLGFHSIDSGDSYAVVDGFIAGPDALLIDDRDNAIDYSSGWGANMAPGRFMGTQTFSNSPGAYANFTFTGTQITYVYDAQQNAGKAQVSIDGRVVNWALDEYSATPMPQQHATFSGLTQGDHTITVTASNDRNSAATDGYVIVDGFIITP